MLTDPVAPTEGEIHNVDSIGMDNREWLGAPLGFCAPVGGVVTELQ